MTSYGCGRCAAGALLIPPLLARAAPDAPLLLWQPVFLVRNNSITCCVRSSPKGSIGHIGGALGNPDLRERCATAKHWKRVAMAISPALADELDRATFCLPGNYRGRIAWLEVVSSAAPSLSPAARKKIDGLRSAGIDIAAKAVQGPGFWQSVETSTAMHSSTRRSPR